jgi:hypothetical protein
MELSLYRFLPQVLQQRDWDEFAPDSRHQVEAMRHFRPDSLHAERPALLLVRRPLLLDALVMISSRRRRRGAKRARWLSSQLRSLLCRGKSTPAGFVHARDAADAGNLSHLTHPGSERGWGRVPVPLLGHADAPGRGRGFHVLHYSFRSESWSNASWTVDWHLPNHRHRCRLRT